ncbi:MAG: ligase-associated DNA damage response DEXH box helicase [Synechococcaceae cyanobacterium]|nr:ligase-associated DNA damage response DEXH box helicase [Synechococcaceae cyanobacterium]
MSEPGSGRRKASRVLLQPIDTWFSQKGWSPLPFQRRSWQAYLEGRSGLIQVPTGCGKTYAAVFGPIAEMLAAAPVAGERPGLQLLVITPLRALSRDLVVAISEPIEAMGWPLKVGLRNGDTSSSERSRQRRSPPEILITTPESLALLLSHEDAAGLFAGLRSVVLDEWHELLGSKRGSQSELCLSWLRQLRPQLRTWALSATIGNLEEAARAAVGAANEPLIIQAPIARTTRIESLLPQRIDGFPWAGHLGLRLHEELVAALDPRVSTLLFTNTRNQAERWHQCLRYVCPEMEETLALHHSSLDRGERERIETGVKDGSIRWVVCTSSLDLGVDFQPVETVVQIGSPRNLARLLQRAGRSAHTPGGVGRVLFLPTNALELLEVSAMRRGLEQGMVEERRAPQAPLDVLLQHLTGLACGGGFDPSEELAVVRSAWSYRDLSDSSWQWCLQFLESGGACLAAYPRFRKLERAPAAAGERFRYRIREAGLARLHRLNIGTITADRSITVRYVRGGVLGHVEEAFIARLKPGDVFFFAGRQLEFVRLREMTAQVKASGRRSTTVPAWAGGQMALSDLVARALRQEVARCAVGLRDNRELEALAPLLERQCQLSRLPAEGEFLVELCHSREGNHLYAYPFEGRFVHEGLGFLWAWRLARHTAGTFTVSVNDHGFELLAARGYPLDALFSEHSASLLSGEALQEDLCQAINLSELCRRRFRTIARVSALVVDAAPGRRSGPGQLQLSAALLHDVFERHEPANLLLAQARREVLEEQLEVHRLEATLQRLRACELRITRPPRPGPFAFPLLAERLNSRLSNESLLERLQRIMDEALRLEG